MKTLTRSLLRTRKIQRLVNLLDGSFNLDSFDKAEDSKAVGIDPNKHLETQNFIPESQLARIIDVFLAF